MSGRGSLVRTRRTWRVVRALVIAGASLAHLVGGAEVGMRQFPHMMPTEKRLMEDAIHSPFHATVPDPDVGFLPPSGLRRLVRTSDFTAVYETDSRGFPNPEPWPSRASLVFLGDSVAFGYGVDVRESFPHVIGDLLSTPVVNLALAGAGPSRQAAVYQKFGIGLRPRHVVACVYAVDFGNDQRFDTWIRRGRTDDYNDLRMTLGRAEDDAETPVLRHYLEKSWLYAHGRDWVLGRLPGRESPPDRYRFPDGSETLLSRGAWAYAATEAVENDPRIEQLLASLQDLEALVKQHGARLSVVLVPSREELFGPPASKTAANIMSRVRVRLVRAGFSVMDLYPAVRDAGGTRSPYFRVDGHFNEHGHRAAADAFVTWFRRAFPDDLDRLRESSGSAIP